MSKPKAGKAVQKGGVLNVNAKEAPAKSAVKAKQAAVADQFAEADAKADPAPERTEAEAIEEVQAGLGVRGY